MEIMKVFSSYDDYGYEDERLYSVLMTEDELVSLFSEDEKRKSLRDVDSHKGLKRTIASGLLLNSGGLGAAVGRYAGTKAAHKADDEGKSSEEILKAARKSGGKAGALTGAGLTAAAIGAASLTKTGRQALKRAGIKGLAASGLMSAGIGYLGGRNSAGVKIKDKILKRELNQN